MKLTIDTERNEIVVSGAGAERREALFSPEGDRIHSSTSGSQCCEVGKPVSMQLTAPNRNAVIDKLQVSPFLTPSVAKSEEDQL